MDIFANVLTSTIIFAVPLLLVALGGMFSERSGVINLSLEGIMIMGALFSCVVLNKLNLVDELQNLCADLCMECGCCSYVCPANRPIVQTNKLAKAKLNEYLREQKAKEDK